MTGPADPKYGAPLTGSDWVGLPLRIGHLEESGVIEDLTAESDVVLVWVGGPSEVTIQYVDPRTGQQREFGFERHSGMVDLMCKGTRLCSVRWRGRRSTCTSVNFPPESLAALSASQVACLVPQSLPQFGIVDAHIVDLVHRLQQQASGKGFLGAMYVQSLSMALAAYLAGRYGAATWEEPIEQFTALTAAQRKRILDFVDRELASNFGLVDLAAELSYSPDHFARLFRQAFHQTPYQFVLSRRIECAMSMLRDNELSIAEIAGACGFASQAHLTTVFKRRIGMTPGAYRKH